ncbi:thioredoxin domain-containing protein [Pedobacter cryotolerans]|uniref:Uncharacterized protein n=1 Tax=Pedobacter cryotolerans TaxID=2571270 RepID=A0A4U1BY86_9SPHI|nr:hypothetical protein [Pedobacter cryotolerans]TKB97423.1 hypothetical protein FA045_15790 [Pedobacter cryotolerans]
MKIFSSLFILFILPVTVFCQISDTKSFENAINLAKKNDKPLLLIISMPAKYLNNIPVNIGLQDPEIKNKLKESFVTFETDMKDSSIRQIILMYKINAFPSFVFMHANKDVFHKDFGSSNTKYKYIQMLATALTLSKEKSVSELEKDYLSNKGDNNNLKKLIELRRKNGITDNAVLIEQFVNNLKISDFNDYQTVLFILQAGPFADGNAYKLAYNNRKIVDSIFKKEPLQKRIDINNAIIQNTLNNAVKNKNIRQAQAAANIARSSNGNNYEIANKNAANNMLYYFKSVKDTSSYIRSAIHYYDTYYMNISADSIKKLEAKQRQVALDRSRPTLTTGKKIISKEKIDSLIKANPNTVKKETTMVSSAVGIPYNNYANELNNAAWNMYETGTKNINHLLKAVTWSTRSIELNPMSSHHDTLAHLFYQLGYFEQAIKAQETAINKAKIEGRPFQEFQEILKKMKSKTL